MVHRVLTSVSWLCCALVLASFSLFVRDQLVSGSKHQQDLIAATAATAATPPQKSHPPAQPRRFIVGAAQRLTSPFDSIVASDSAWVNHAMPTLFGLLAYGVGLGFIARYMHGRA